MATSDCWPSRISERHAISLDSPPTLLVVGDADRLAQVVGNLLYIARGIVDALGGRIWAESEGQQRRELPCHAAATAQLAGNVDMCMCHALISRWRDI